MKKILFVLPSLEGGGAERVTLHLIDYLHKKKYDIRIVLFSDQVHYSESLPENIGIKVLGKKNRFSFFKLIFGVAREIREYKPQIIISCIHYANIITTLGSFLSRKDYSLIIWEHSNPRYYLIRERLSLLKRKLMSITYKKADIIITVSKAIKRIIEKDFSIPSHRIHPIYNPVPLGMIKKASTEKVNHRFFDDPGNTVLISVGRLDISKRFDRLLEAFKRAYTINHSLRLLILGQGNLESELKNISLKLGISERVDFIGFQKNPYAWMKQADIFVLSSDYEGFPMVLIESMACETPIISVDCPTGPDELIVSGENGLLIKMSCEAIADGICTLVNDDSMQQKFISKGKKTIEDFTYEKIFPEFEKLFF